jgi:hypothetical protein
MEKPTLTICVMTKNDICALTAACFINVCNETNDKYLIKPHIALGQSDLPKARSEQVSNWFDNAKSKDAFLFIDADQTFTQTDINTTIFFLQYADIVCAAYARKNGTMTVQPKDPIKFYAEKNGELWYGPTGFMAFTYDICKKISEKCETVVSYDASTLKRNCYPFFLERIIDDPEIGRKNAWLSEDYSFCWLARQHGAKIMGYISPTLGHIIPIEKFVNVPNYKKWPAKSIAIYCGKTAEYWSAKNIKTGIGGSELAVIELSKEWVKKGYMVKVYCYCDEPGIYDGVHYEHETNFGVLDRFDILIIWRQINILNFFDMHANKCILDLHDLVTPEQVTPRVLKNINKICVKSNFHASLLGNINSSKYAVIPNGGYKNKLEDIKRDSNYIIYASSYDRGLPFILKWAWPEIKKACPNAYLKIFYGWNGFDSSKQQTSDVLKYKEIILELMKQDGVEECGRISQEELLKEKAKANVHLYTGDFQEIDCISIRESVCMGAIPVVSKQVKVFEEKSYCILVDGDPRTREMQEKAAQKVIELLNNTEMTEEIRKNMKIPYEETWENIASRWETEVFNDNNNNNELELPNID